MNQVAPLPVRIVLSVFCGVIAFVAFSAGRAMTNPTAAVFAYSVGAIFSAIAVFAFTHPRTVLSGLALPIGVGAICGGMNEWHTDQIVPLLIGVGVLVACVVIIRFTRRGMQNAPFLRLVIGSLLVGGLVFGFGVVTSSSLGYVLLGSLFVAQGVDGIISTVKHHVDLKSGGDA